ncbi:MAG: hypothetical protein K6G26_04610 [Lachnospiraceae bacterium]|nr:hypothetical protein [Lachnospiraceae bacterium]
MAEKYDYFDEINNDYGERMKSIMKFYPFFRIYQDGLKRFQDERLKDINTGLVIFAVLRYMVEENNFLNRGVTYTDIREYLSSYIAYTYNIYMDNDTKEALTSEVYAMLTNQGLPYEYNYYNPCDKKTYMSRVTYIKAKIDTVTGVLNHYITDSGIEFYLETKEIRELNNISIQQILLEKMVNSRNFKGARQVVRRMSNEVSMLYEMKKEILSIIGNNESEGDRLYEHFQKESMGWFEQEEDYFAHDLKLVEEARNKTSNSDNEDTIRDINLLNDELKKASAKYGALLNEYVDLKKKTDDIRNKRKIKVLMSTFDFQSACEKIAESRDAGNFSLLVNPLMDINRQKFFDLGRIDEILNIKVQEEDEADIVEEVDLSDYVFDDEVENERILTNHNNFLKCLFFMLNSQQSFSLRGYNKILETVFSDNIFLNGDYYSFLIALSAKDRYIVRNSEDTKDETVLDAAIRRYNEIYKDAISFEIKFLSDDKVELKSGFSTTNIMFRRLTYNQ